jgi:hypothetical protein
MIDDPFYALKKKPSPPPHNPAPGEKLFEFVRNRALISCELLFHGEPYGWEAQFLERGNFLYSRGGFPTRAVAVAWAESERTAMEQSPASRLFRES